MRSAARDAMMIANVDAYAGDNRERSVFRMVTAALRAQPKAYIRADFPPQFLQEDRLALSHVHTKVRRQVKNVQHLVRNHALTGVVLGHSHMVLLVIPTLDVYARELWKYLMGASAVLSDGQVDAALARAPQLKAWFAYIRLATMANHFDLAAQSISHWDQIDGQLQANRPRSENWNNA